MHTGSKNIEVLAVSKSRWTGQRVAKIGSYTIFHSSTPSMQVHGVASILSLKAASACEAAGSVLHRFRISVKTHFGFATIITV